MAKKEVIKTEQSAEDKAKKDEAIKTKRILFSEETRLPAMKQ